MANQQINENHNTIGVTITCLLTVKPLIVDLDVGVRGPTHWFRRPRAPLFHITWKGESRMGEKGEDNESGYVLCKKLLPFIVLYFTLFMFMFIFNANKVVFNVIIYHISVSVQMSVLLDNCGQMKIALSFMG